MLTTDLCDVNPSLNKNQFDSIYLVHVTKAFSLYVYTTISMIMSH